MARESKEREPKEKGSRVRGKKEQTWLKNEEPFHDGFMKNHCRFQDGFLDIRHKNTSKIVSLKDDVNFMIVFKKTIIETHIQRWFLQN